jgi:hypothetical protein
MGLDKQEQRSLPCLLPAWQRLRILHAGGYSVYHTSRHAAISSLLSSWSAPTGSSSRVRLFASTSWPLFWQQLASCLPACSTTCSAAPAAATHHTAAAAATPHKAAGAASLWHLQRIRPQKQHQRQPYLVSAAPWHTCTPAGLLPQQQPCLQPSAATAGGPQQTRWQQRWRQRRRRPADTKHAAGGEGGV